TFFGPSRWFPRGRGDSEVLVPSPPAPAYLVLVLVLALGHRADSWASSTSTSTSTSTRWTRGVHGGAAPGRQASPAPPRNPGIVAFMRVPPRSFLLSPILSGICGDIPTPTCPPTAAVCGAGTACPAGTNCASG